MFKKDVTDYTTSMSLLAAANMQADIDGDALNFTLLLDDLMSEMFKPLSPHHSVPSLAEPFSVSGRLTLQTPGVGTISNYLSKREYD